MRDIVIRLRYWNTPEGESTENIDDVLRDGAEEIERLRAALKRIRDEVNSTGIVAAIALDALTVRE